MSTQKTPTRGMVILVALVFFAIFLTIASALIGYIIQYRVTERHAVASTKALYLAEAGFDKAVYELNQNAAYGGESGTQLGDGEFLVSVSSIDATTKKVTATGYVPNSTNPTATRSVTATVAVNSSIVSFRFGVQVGDGGVVMGNGSQINGNLYSNGNVVGGGNAIITGDATVAGGTAETANQEWTTQNSGINIGDVSARTAIAQSFRPSTTNTIQKVSLYLRKIGTPGDLTIRIVTDNGGKPSNVVLASGSLLASSVSSGYAFIDGTLTSSPTLTAGTTYWILATNSVSSSNYFVWGSDATDSYSLGTGKTTANWNVSNATWALTYHDLDFKTWMGGVITSLTGTQINGTVWAHAISNCQVGGNALYQTISSCTVAGTKTVTTSNAPPSAMPISDAQIDEWESIASTGGVISGNYSVNGTQLLGPIAIDGDLTVNGTLYLTGPIWVKGNVTFSNNSSLIVHSSTGSAGAILIADRPGSESTKGVVSFSNNVTIAGNGTTGSYPMVLSTNTGSSAIALNNNASGVILYAPNGTITVSNNAAANQITAKTLNLSNNTTINYVNGLQSVSFSNGPGGSWTFVPGTYAIVP